MKDSGRVRLDHPAQYSIRVQGWVSDRWTEWVNGMALARLGDDSKPVTALTGTVADQAALLGLLIKLYNLGFVLLEVKQTGGDPGKECCGFDEREAR